MKLWRMGDMPQREAEVMMIYQKREKVDSGVYLPVS